MADKLISLEGLEEYDVKIKEYIEKVKSGEIVVAKINTYKHKTEEAEDGNDENDKP